jgi:hypothetical protein
MTIQRFAFVVAPIIVAALIPSLVSVGAVGAARTLGYSSGRQRKNG